MIWETTCLILHMEVLSEYLYLMLIDYINVDEIGVTYCMPNLGQVFSSE